MNRSPVRVRPLAPNKRHPINRVPFVWTNSRTATALSTMRCAFYIFLPEGMMKKCSLTNLYSCARLPDGRALNTLRKAVFARLRRERRLTRNRRSALLHLQSNKNRNFSLLPLLESLNLCANFNLVMIF